MKNNLKKSRLVPLNIENMPPECMNIINRIPGEGLKGKYAPVNVLGMLMHNPDTLKQFLDYWVTSKLKMGFSVREQELVILRMAVHYRCNYVWKHHVPVAVEFGVTGAELAAVREIPLSGNFTAREEALLVLTDLMVNDRDVGDEIFDKYRGNLKDSELVDLISLVSQYVLFSLLNNILRVQIESPLASIPGL
jgi:4-carboxymuconolactone decarboxylase